MLLVEILSVCCETFDIMYVCIVKLQRLYVVSQSVVTLSTLYF